MTIIEIAAGTLATGVLGGAGGAATYLIRRLNALEAASTEHSVTLARIEAKLQDGLTLKLEEIQAELHDHIRGEEDRIVNALIRRGV